MKNLFNRILSLLTVFVISFSLFVVPAYADTADDIGSSVGGFAEWLYRLSYPGEVVVNWWQSLFTSDGDSTAYSTYVSDLDSTLGTYTVTNNGLRLYFQLIGVYRFSTVTLGTDFYAGWTAAASTDYRAQLYMNYLTLPFDCSYSVGYAVTAVNMDMDSIYASLAADGTASLGTHLGPCGIGTSTSQTYINCSPLVGSSLSSISGSFYVDIVPVTGTVSDNTGVDVSSDTRAGSLAGDLMYVGDNGTQVVADDVTLFDESTGTVYNPSTNESYNTTDWNYDYSTRTYNYTTDTGDTGTVSYGDSNASVTLTNSDGNTITYNYYYTVSGSSDSPSDVGSTSWWSTILQKLADGIAAVFDLIGTVIGAIIGGLSDLVVSVVGGLTTLVGNLGQLPTAIGNLFVWLPPELQSVIGASFTVLIFAGLLKMFL